MWIKITAHKILLLGPIIKQVAINCVWMSNKNVQMRKLIRYSSKSSFRYIQKANATYEFVIFLNVNGQKITRFICPET